MSRTFDEALRLHGAGRIHDGELVPDVLEGLTLSNLHERLGSRAVLHAVRGRDVPGPFDLTCPATDASARARLVFRTWQRAPAGGWLRWPSLWTTLRTLEAAVDAHQDVASHLSDPSPVVRMWAVVGCDGRDDLATLERSLEDPDPEVVLLTAAALLRRDRATPAVRRSLLGLLSGSHATVAIGLVGPLFDPDACRPLMQCYRAGHQEALEWLAFPEALAVLRQALSDDVHGASRALIGLGPRARAVGPDVVARVEELTRGPMTPDDVMHVGDLLEVLTSLGPDAPGVAEARARWSASDPMLAEWVRDRESC